MKTDQVNADKNAGNESADRKTEQRILRELDAEVAQKVLGWTVAPEGNRWRVSRTGEYVNSWSVDSPNLADLDDDVDDHLYGQYAMPSYSTDISAAMEVVEKFIAQGGRVALRGGVPELMGEDVPAGHWQVNFFRFLRDVPPGTRFSFTVAAPTLPEAICRAALEASECLSISDRRNDGQAS